MGKHSKGNSRLDKFYHLAKEQGYRSRAAFKLIQLNKKYNFFTECQAVLDLCAAPGGWMQVAVKYLPVNHLVVGVDLVPIRPIRGATSIVADITTDKCKKLIEKESNGRLFDVVLNDGSPNIGGAWHSESLSQAMLVLDALKLATNFLAPDGWFISKVFRSKDYNALTYVCHQLFEKVEATKPTASRHTSAEIFLVCQNYKAPGKIDPKLLDARYVLQEFASGNSIHGPVVMQKRQSKKMHRRFREGYEEGISTTFKTASILDFIRSDDPVEMCGQYTQFTFTLPESSETNVEENEKALQIVMDHKKTTEEIKEACQDLWILGKSEFKKLLKWQMSLSKVIESRKPKEAKEETELVNPEERMLKEMEAIRDRIQHKVKKREKKQRQMKKQFKKRVVQFKQSEGMVEDTIQDPELFQLGDFHDEKDLEHHRSETNDSKALEALNESDNSESEGDENDEMRYEAMEEDYLERSYQRFLRRKGEEANLEDSVLKKRKRLDQKGELSEEEMEDIDAPSEIEAEQNRTPGGGLLVEWDGSKAGIATTPDAIATQWFRHSDFEDPDLMEIDVPHPKPLRQKSKLPAKPEDQKLQLPAKPASVEMSEELSEIEEPEETNAEAGKEKHQLEVDEETEEIEQPEEKDAEADGFEIVKKEEPKADSGTDTEDEFRMLDLDGKAEIIAMARKMVHRKEKEDLIDAAYSKYIFHDKNLPKWFEHDNDVYNRPHRMVSREEIETEKEMLRAMDSRPIKKVAEAKSRKTKRLANRLRSAMKRAEGIANQEELSYRTRMRQMTKMVNTAKRKENQKFVSKEQLKKMGRNKKQNVTKKMPRLDRRMKSDKRMKGVGRNAKHLKKIKKQKSVEKHKAISKKRSSKRI